jgi:YggT family protein
MSFVIRFIDLLFDLFYLAILARVLMSWVNIRPDHPVVRFLYDITEPVLAPIRRIIPSMGMMDLSPVAAMILLYIVRVILDSVLRSF